MANGLQKAYLQEASLTGLPLPLTLRPTVPLTEDELTAFSRRNKLYRIEQNAKGELEIMSPVGGEGGNLESEVNFQLALWAQQHGGRTFSSSTGFRLSDGSILSPDAAWLSQSRWEALSREQQRDFPPLCPEFLIEILSETDSRKALETKMQTWLANGARLAWMIDPHAATLSVYMQDQPSRVLTRPPWIEATNVVPEFRLAMEKLWLG